MRKVQAIGDNHPKSVFAMRIRREDGTRWEAEIGTGYDDRTVMRPFGQGIVVEHPEKHPVYVNAATRQVGHNPEICRSALILTPTPEGYGAKHKTPILLS